MNHLIINISQVLAKIGNRQEFKKIETFSPIKLSDGLLEFSRPVSFNLCVENVGEGVQVSGIVESEFYLTCYRCLGKFSQPVRVKMREIFRKYGRKKELPPEGERFEIIKECIDVGQAAEQAFLLALPVKILCTKNCKGLCPICGKNLNEEECSCTGEQIDPRLLKLKNLLDK